MSSQSSVFGEKEELKAVNPIETIVAMTRLGCAEEP
jgi:hypothetical protein